MARKYHPCIEMRMFHFQTNENNTSETTKVTWNIEINEMHFVPYIRNMVSIVPAVLQLIHGILLHKIIMAPRDQIKMLVIDFLFAKFVKQAFINERTTKMCKSMEKRQSSTTKEKTKCGFS